MIILGVDPGLSGAIVAIWENGKIHSKLPFPTVPESRGRRVINLVQVSAYLRTLPKIKMAFIEKVHSMPKQGVSGVFSFGRSYGQLEGVITSLNIPLERVTPQAWTKEMHKKVNPKLETKKRSFLVASRLYPNETFIAPRARTPHSGLIDACLIALWGRKKLIKDKIKKLKKE